MKAFLLPIALTFVFATSASASVPDKCYVAKDTSAMVGDVERLDPSQNTTEKIVRASLRLHVQPADKYSSETKMAYLKIKTESGVRATVGSAYYPSERVYAVECDGGRMKLRRDKDGNVIVTTNYIRAEQEGCDGDELTVRLATSGTKFTRVSCGH